VEVQLIEGVAGKGFEMQRGGRILGIAALLGMAVLTAVGPVLAQAPPTLKRVELTADGYVLVGAGFATDKGKVQVFEGATPVPSASVVSVANDRIVVRSKPAGTVQHKVVVSGRASAVVSFSHARDAAARPAPARPADAQPGSSPTSVTVASVTVSPSSVAAGTKATGTVTLTSPAPREGAAVTLSRSVGAITMPSTVTVPAGQTTATFQIATQAVTATTTITISATHTGTTKTGQLVVAPAGFQPKSVTASELTMTGQRFQPKSVTASELTMTGRRFQPKSVTASELTMTGQRFQPKSVTASELTMTGQRE
jgi:hypothetical protein